MTSPTAQAVTCTDCGTEGTRDLSSVPEFIRADRMAAPWFCPRCHDERAAAAVREEEREEAEWQRQEALAGRERRARSLPAAYRGLELDGLERTPSNAAALDSAALWAAGELTGLVFTGPVGTGKTTIAAAAAWRLMLDQATAWASVPVLLTHALAAFDSDERAKATRLLTGTGPLILDDLDKAKASDWAAAQLFAAIDQRYSAGAPLLVTMNITPGALADRIGGEFGDAIASRLIGYCRSVRVDGPDRRLAGPGA